MRSDHFDPFGEPLLRTKRDSVGAAPQDSSTAVLRLGVGLFWGLVVAIVAARIVYFDPDFARSFGAVASTCLQAIAG